MDEQSTPAPAQVDPSTMQPNDATTESVYSLRDAIKTDTEFARKLIASVKEIGAAQGYAPDSDVGEMIANATLAMRHLEDAAMRLGKVLQAKNGGVSILSR